jgi:cobalt-precorrin-5B (C1)-methyltransferase
MTRSEGPPDPPQPQARPGGQNLRWGFSTGTAATAAALAAARRLVEGRAPEVSEPALPGGRRLPVAVESCGPAPGGGFRAVVIKDAGDDPDVTHLARVGATVRPSARPGLSVSGGPGVGRATRPGLVLAVGSWAINPVPMRMLAENLAAFPGALGTGLEAVVDVEGGEELAKRTLNPRLGILGGVSILGTTGLVRPYSHGAYVGAIDSSMRVARAAGVDEAVLTTGVRSEALIRADRPDLPETAFFQIADFFRSGLKLAVHHGFSTIGLAVFFGKAVKQAQGLPYTHAHHGDLLLAPLAGRLTGLGPETLRLFSAAPTAMAALEVLRSRGGLGAVAAVAGMVAESARAFAGPGPGLWVRIYDFGGQLLAAAEA